MSEALSEARGQRLIAEFDKNSAEKVRVTLQEWKCQTYLDIRVFYSDDKGAWLPTKKGITLNAELVGELRAGIDAALAALELGAPPMDDADQGHGPKSDEGIPF